MRCTRVALLLGAGVAVCACTPPGVPGDTGEQDWTPRAARCLRVDQVDNWRVIDTRQLIVYGPGRNDPWHVRLFAACVHLPSAEVLAFRARGTDRLCGDPGDEILVRGERCAIVSFTPVSPAEAAALLDADVHQDIGKLPPPTEKPDQ